MNFFLECLFLKINKFLFGLTNILATKLNWFIIHSIYGMSLGFSGQEIIQF